MKVGDLVRMSDWMGVVVAIESRNTYGDPYTVKVWWSRTNFLGSAFVYALEFLCEA